VLLEKIGNIINNYYELGGNMMEPYGTQVFKKIPSHPTWPPFFT
jgi:hypothetical protein